MKLWVISDTHFFHKNILEYENRPFKNIEEMNETLISNWNKVVSPEDVIIHCGDLSLGRNKETSDIMNRLNGNKILVFGNHDHFSVSFILKNSFIKAVKGELKVEINGQPTIFTHFPPESEFIVDSIEYYFGHVHSKKCSIESFPNAHCVCVERTDYKPILITDNLKSINFD